MRAGRTWGRAGAWRHLDAPGLVGRRVYLAGPRTGADPEAFAVLEATLLDLGVIRRPAAEDFPAAAAALRAAGARVSCPHEHSWWRGSGPGSDLAAADLRAARAADATALHEADLVTVLDGWMDVPGAVDAAVLVARTSGTRCEPVAETLRGIDLRAPVVPSARLRERAEPLRRRAS